MTGRPAGCSLHKHPTYDEYLACRFGDAEAQRISIQLAQRDHHPDRRLPSMSTTTAKLSAAKLTDEIGISEEDAQKLFATLGSRRVAIVKLEPFRREEGIDDTGDIVKLKVTHLELMPDGRLADLARDMSRKAYDIRQPAPLDPQIDDETADQLADRGNATLQLVGDPEPAMAT